MNLFDRYDALETQIKQKTAIDKKSETVITATKKLLAEAKAEVL